MSIYSKFMLAIRGGRKPTLTAAPVEVVEPPYAIPAVTFDQNLITEEIRADLRNNIKELAEFDETNFDHIYDAALRSMTRGRDLATLAKAIMDLNLPAMTECRAGEIARILHNKATALINRDRQISVGIEYAIWMYANAPCMLNPRHPTPADRSMDEAHKAADGTRYQVANGLVLNGRRTWPGRREGCRCFSKSIVPGFS
jgi:hypothetical protein